MFPSKVQAGPPASMPVFSSESAGSKYQVSRKLNDRGIDRQEPHRQALKCPKEGYVAGASKRVRRRPPDRHFDPGSLDLSSVPGTSGSRPKPRESLKVASHTLQRGFPGCSPSGVRMRLPRGSVGSACAGVRAVSLLGPAPGCNGVCGRVRRGVHSGVRRRIRSGGGAEGIVEQVIPWFHRCPVPFMPSSAARVFSWRMAPTRAGVCAIDSNYRQVISEVCARRFDPVKRWP